MTDTFRLDVTTSNPYKEWAKEGANFYEEGFNAAVEGVMFSPCNASAYIRGYEAAVGIFGDHAQYRKFKEVLGY